MEGVTILYFPLCYLDWIEFLWFVMGRKLTMMIDDPLLFFYQKYLKKIRIWLLTCEYFWNKLLFYETKLNIFKFWTADTTKQDILSFGHISQLADILQQQVIAKIICSSIDYGLIIDQIDPITFPRLVSV